MQSDDTYPISTIQRNSDNVITVSANFAESGDYILFNDRQLLAAYLGISKGLKFQLRVTPAALQTID